MATILDPNIPCSFQRRGGYTCRTSDFRIVSAFRLASAEGVDGLGEADMEECPVNILPAERVYHGW